MTTTRTISDLSLYANCAYPDSETSPGAKFLLSISDAYDEDRERILADPDAVFEIADSLVPVYTYEMWKTFVDLGAWDQDISDIIGDRDNAGMDKRAMTALYVIAERVIHRLKDNDE